MLQVYSTRARSQDPWCLYHPWMSWIDLWSICSFEGQCTPGYWICCMRASSSVGLIHFREIPDGPKEERGPPRCHVLRIRLLRLPPNIHNRPRAPHIIRHWRYHYIGCDLTDFIHFLLILLWSSQKIRRIVISFAEK